MTASQGAIDSGVEQSCASRADTHGRWACGRHVGLHKAPVWVAKMTTTLVQLYTTHEQCNISKSRQTQLDIHIVSRADWVGLESVVVLASGDFIR